MPPPGHCVAQVERDECHAATCLQRLRRVGTSDPGETPKCWRPIEPARPATGSHDRAQPLHRRAHPGGPALGGAVASLLLSDPVPGGSGCLPVFPRSGFFTMRTRTLVLLAATMVLAGPAAGYAQDKAAEVNFGGGFSFPSGKIGDSFDTGWNGAIGVTFNATPVVGIQAEYMYQRFGGPDRQFTAVPTPQDTDTLLTIESNHQVHAGTFNLVFRTPSTGSVGAYVLAGPGVYHRIVQLTSPSVGFASVCDPYWLVCYPVPVSTDQILGDRSSTDFGVNFGGGLTFGRAAKFYVEARYHYVWGPKLEAAGTSYSTNAQYFPVTFGFRF